MAISKHHPNSCEAHWLPSSSLFFNPLEWLWEKQQLCLYMLPCKMEPTWHTVFTSVSTRKLWMLGIHDSLEKIPSWSQGVWTLALRIGIQQELWCLLLSVGLYLYCPHLSVTSGNYVKIMKLFGMKIQNLVKRQPGSIREGWSILWSLFGTSQQPLLGFPIQPKECSIAKTASSPQG